MPILTILNFATLKFKGSRNLWAVIKIFNNSTHKEQKAYLFKYSSYIF